MIKRKLHIFVEGAVDREVLVSLDVDPMDITTCNGKQKMIGEIEKIAGPDLHGYNQLGIVIFRDRDGDEMEEDIKQSFLNGFKNLLTKNIQPFKVLDAEKYPNVYWSQYEERDENFNIPVEPVFRQKFNRDFEDGCSNLKRIITEEKKCYEKNSSLRKECRWGKTDDGDTPVDVVTAGLEWAEHLGIGGMGTRGFGRVRTVGKPWEVTAANYGDDENTLYKEPARGGRKS